MSSSSLIHINTFVVLLPATVNLVSRYVSDIHLLSKNVHNRENECGENMEVDYEFMEGFGAIPSLDDTGIDNIEMQTELGEESSEQVINDNALKDSVEITSTFLLQLARMFGFFKFKF